MTGSGAVGLQRDGAVATVRVGTGRRANALGTRDWEALGSLFRDLADDSSLSAVVLSGRGNSSFSAGSDMREWLSAEPAEIDASFAAMESALTAIEASPIPVVARIRGAATGAGCQLACACDLRIIASNAKIGMPVARWGILVPPPFAARVALLTGPGAARDLLMTGRLVDGQEAVRLGLAGTSVPEAELDSATSALIASITDHPPAAIRAAKQSIDTLLGPERDRLHRLPAGPAADYDSLQRGLSTFLSKVTNAG